MKKNSSPSGNQCSTTTACIGLTVNIYWNVLIHSSDARSLFHPNDFCEIISVLLKKIQTFIRKPWYVFLIAFLLGLDHFILFLPADILALSALFGKRKNVWLRAFILALGSSLGIFLLVILVQSNVKFDFNIPWIERFFKGYGLWAVAALGALPVPQQPAAILAALSGVSSLKIFLMCFLGRLLKFELYAWACKKMPPFTTT